MTSSPDSDYNSAADPPPALVVYRDGAALVDDVGASYTDDDRRGRRSR